MSHTQRVVASTRKFWLNLRVYSTGGVNAAVEPDTIDKKIQYYKNLNETQSVNVTPTGWSDALPFEKIPGPKPLPLIGNIWRYVVPKIGDFYGLDLQAMLKLLREKYGDVVVLKGIPGRPPMVYLYNPKDVETIYKNEGPWPIRDGLPSFTYYRTVTRKNIFQGYGGVMTVQGEDWFRFRSTVNSIIMKPRNVLQYVEKMDRVAGELVDNMAYFASLNKENEMPANFLHEIYKWSLESIGVITLDRHLGTLKRDLKPDSEPAMLIQSVLEMFNLMYKLDVLPSLWRVLPTPAWKRYVKVLDFLTNTNMKSIQEATAKINNGLSAKSPEETSVLEKLLEKNPKIAVAMAMDMMIAGVDTTGRVLGATLYYLARYPEKQKILREEVLKLLPNKNSPITRDTLENAKYLNAVIKETTRMAPIAIGNLRSAPKDIILGGYQIPKGTQVITNNFILSNEDEHFPRAKEFLPERWLRTTEGELSFKNANQFIFQPFGFGPRSCIGKRLANLELHVATLKIIRNFELSWPHEDMVFKTTVLHGIAAPLKLHVSPLDI